MISVILLVFLGQHSNVKGQDRVKDGRKGVARTTVGTVQRGSSTTTGLSDSTFTNITDLSTTPGLCPETNNDSSTSASSCVIKSEYFDPDQILDERDYAGYVVIPLFLVLGLFGNTMTIIVMASRRFRQAAFSLLLIFMSCSDTAFILTQPWNKPWMVDLLGVDIRAISEVGCKIFFVFLQTAKMSSSWLMVVVCFERFVAVCYPLRAKIIFTKFRTIVGIAFVYITLFSYTGAWSVFSMITTSGKCDPDFVDTAVIGRAFMIVGTLLYAVIPTILLLFVTPAFVCRLYQQWNQRQEMTTRGGDNQPADALRTTAMFLGIATAYIILVSPMWIGQYVAYTRGETLFQSTDSILVVFRQVAQPLEQLNYCINFFLCALLSRTFRRHVAWLLSCGRCSQKNEGIINVTKTPTNQQPTSEMYTNHAAAVKISVDSNCGGHDNEVDDQKEQPEVDMEPPIATNSDVANNI